MTFLSEFTKRHMSRNICRTTSCGALHEAESAIPNNGILFGYKFIMFSLRVSL